MVVAKGSPADPTGADFSTPIGTALKLAADDVSFELDTYDKPPTTGGQDIPVEVRAVLTATAVAGVSDEQVTTTITAKLKQFLANLTPGTTIDAGTLLTALRDDTKYMIDPLKLQVTITSEGQFVQVAQGGATFTVQPHQVFSIASVGVNP
jgi:hypothetical protein